MEGRRRLLCSAEALPPPSHPLSFSAVSRTASLWAGWLAWRSLLSSPVLSLILSRQHTQRPSPLQSEKQPETQKHKNLAAAATIRHNPAAVAASSRRRGRWGRYGGEWELWQGVWRKGVTAGKGEGPLTRTRGHCSALPSCAGIWRTQLGPGTGLGWIDTVSSVCLSPSPPSASRLLLLLTWAQQRKGRWLDDGRGGAPLPLLSSQLISPSFPPCCAPASPHCLSSLLLSFPLFSCCPMGMAHKEQQRKRGREKEQPAHSWRAERGFSHCLPLLALPALVWHCLPPCLCSQPLLSSLCHPLLPPALPASTARGRVSFIHSFLIILLPPASASAALLR